MKKQNSIFIALVIILTASQACSVGGIAPSTEVEQEPTLASEQGPTAVSEQTSSVATIIPSQEAGGVDGPAGPETIDLTNPAFYIVPSAPAFTFEMTIKYIGVDTTGTANEASLYGSTEIQTQPQITQRFLSLSKGGVSGAGSAETVIIGDQLYTVLTGIPGCNTFLASSMQGPSMLESMFQLQKWITGQAPLVESGIEVNGYVTDKYELSSENFVDVPGELVSAFVYVARNGGFITLFESQGREKIDSYGFDPNQFTDFTIAYNYILVEDGSLDISIPAGCDNQAGLAGEFPVMDGATATSLVTKPGEVFYQIEKPLTEVLDFYRAEMPNRGWTLTEDAVVGSFATLVFSKDGKYVEVKALGNGDTVSVTIKEK